MPYSPLRSATLPRTVLPLFATRRMIPSRALSLVTLFSSSESWSRSAAATIPSKVSPVTKFSETRAAVTCGGNWSMKNDGGTKTIPCGAAPHAPAASRAQLVVDDRTRVRVLDQDPVAIAAQHVRLEADAIVAARAVSFQRSSGLE